MGLCLCTVHPAADAQLWLLIQLVVSAGEADSQHSCANPGGGSGSGGREGLPVFIHGQS